mmetsp:Transcript_12740/g.24042  ORF Transcript_12740/g.24042 Transcript_12740/m.24042 type:complete len:433 (-) Transcript_12740:1124-2422(-)
MNESAVHNLNNLNNLFKHNLNTIQRALDCSHGGLLVRLLVRLFDLGLHPHVVVLDKFHQLVHRLVHLDPFSHNLLSVIQVDLSWHGADVSEIGVCHLARSVNDAAHDGDGDSGKVPRLLLDGVGDLLKVEERAAAGGAAHVVRLGAPHPAALKHSKARESEELQPKVPWTLQDQAVPEAIHEKGTALCTSGNNYIVPLASVEDNVVQHRGFDVALLDVLEELPGDVHSALLQLHFQVEAQRVHGGSALEILARLLPAEKEGDVLDSLGEEGGHVPSRRLELLHGDQSNRPLDGVLLELRERSEKAHLSLLEPLDREHCSRVRGVRQLLQDNRVRGRDVLERQPQHELGPQVSVQQVRIVKGLQIDHAVHAPVPVKKLAGIQRGRLVLRLRKSPLPLLEGGEVAVLLLERIHANLQVGGLRSYESQPGARLHL